MKKKMLLIILITGAAILATILIIYFMTANDKSYKDYNSSSSSVLSSSGPLIVNMTDADKALVKVQKALSQAAPDIKSYVTDINGLTTADISYNWNLSQISIIHTNTPDIGIHFSFDGDRVLSCGTYATNGVS